MKRIRSFNRSYVFEIVKSDEIIRLLSLFGVKNVFMEIFNIEKDSTFYKNIQSRKNEDVLLSNSFSETYADIFISKCFGEKFRDVLDEIIESKPEILAFYLTDLTLEDFLCHNRRILSGNQMITKQIAVCVIEIMFDENAFVIACKSDLAHQFDLS